MFAEKIASWAYPGAILDWDFANGRYTGEQIGGGTANFASNRNVTGMTELNGGIGSATVKGLYAPDSNGMLWGFNQYVMRITPGRGLWIEGSNTNYCRNCRDLTAGTWTAANMTASVANIPGADGGTISSAVKSAGGSNYAVNDLIYLVGGGVLKVTAITGSAVNTVSVVDKGRYQIIPSNPVAQFATTGSGSGATFTITWTSAASRITASAGLATILDVQVLTSATYVGSAYVKRVTGTGTIEMTEDNGATYTNITSQLNTSTFTKIEIPSQAALVNTGIGFRITTSGDAIDVDFVQLENCLNSITNASTPILTTGSSATRGAEGAFFDDQSATTGYNAGWKFLKNYFFNRSVSGLFVGDGYGTAGGVRPSFLTTDSTFVFTGGLDGGVVNLLSGSTGGSSVSSSNSGTAGLGNTNRAGFSLEGGQCVVFLNGTVTVDGTVKITTDVPVSTSHGCVGNRGAGDKPINGCLQRMTIFPKPGPHAHMNFITRVG